MDLKRVFDFGRFQLTRVGDQFAALGWQSARQLRREASKIRSELSLDSERHPQMGCEWRPSQSGRRYA
jgi:hypothetical protein